MIIKNKEKIFWDWFEKNKTKLENFIDSNQEDYSIYHELTRELKSYNELLNPELTGDEDGSYCLIVTPDGIREGVEPTTKIIYSAPDIKEWKFFRFRQAKDIFGIKINEVEVDIPDIKIIRKLDLENKGVDITVCFKDYEDANNDFKSVGFLMLDHVVGEMNMLARVDAVDFLSWDDIPKENETITLLELRKEIEEKLY
jgi:hypothetical protein